MKNKFPHIQIFLSGILFLCLISMSCIMAVSAKEFSGGWYFKKTEDHTQPPLDAPLAYTRDLDSYFCGSPEERVIYLTFDAGYETGNIAKILDTLKAHHAQGAFFVLSHLIEDNTDLVKRMAAEGHLVCNHTMHHKDMTILSPEAIGQELCGLAKLYSEKTGCDMAPFYRPPEGKFNRQSLETVRSLGYKTIFWSYAYCDWDNKKQPDPEKSAERILAHTHNGMVLLLHPTSDTNAAILDRLLTAWEEQGYRFGSLYELTEK
ncbi:MAG: polysaccharide deacetylase family protein [Clostridia bacterium]|nr:polysaccharide deacetylase family protein [Clostridia bacterium]